MELREYLLSGKVFSDTAGNTVCFSEYNLNQLVAKNGIWIFLDEGLRCGGMVRDIPCTMDGIKEALIGCGKEALWQIILEEIIKK